MTVCSPRVKVARARCSSTGVQVIRAAGRAAGASTHRSFNTVTVSARVSSGPEALTIGSSEQSLTRIVAESPVKTCRTSTGRCAMVACHREEPFGRGSVGVDLFAGELHPGLVGTASDPAVDERPGRRPTCRFADRAGLADVPGDGSRKRYEVALGEDRPGDVPSAARRSGPSRSHPSAPAARCSVLALETVRAVSGVGVRSPRTARSTFGSVPNAASLQFEHDHELGQQGRDCSHRPPPPHRGEEQRSRRHRRHGRQQPCRAHGRADRLRQRGYVRPTQPLGGTEQMEAPWTMTTPPTALTPRRPRPRTASRSRPDPGARGRSHCLGNSRHGGAPPGVHRAMAAQRRGR